MQTKRNTFKGAFQEIDQKAIKNGLSLFTILIITVCSLLGSQPLDAQTLTDPPTSHTVQDCQSEYSYTIPSASQNAWQISGGRITQGGGTGSTSAKVIWDQGAATGWVRATYTIWDGVNGNSSITGEVNVTIDPPTPGSLNAVAPICYNTTPTITSDTAPWPTGSAPVYSWQQSVGTVTGSESPSVISWQTISQSGPFTEDYTPPNSLTASKYYRRRATICNTAVFTDPVFVEVYSQLNPGTISVSFSCNNATASLSGTAATGGNTTSSYTYVWQSRPSSGGTWSTASTSITSLTGPTVFRRRVSSLGCNDTKYSNEVTISPEGLVQTKSLDLTQEAFCYGDQPFVKLANSQPDVDYELYRNGSATGSIKTGTGSALTWNVNTAGDYTVMAINNTVCGPLPMTGTAEIVKYSQLNPGTISVNFNCNNATASLSGTAATGGNTTSSYTYVWQSKPSVGGSWATTSTTITSLSGPTLFRRMVSSATCNEFLQSSPTQLIEIKPEDLIQTYSLDLAQEAFCYEEQPFVKISTSQVNVDYELYLNANPTGNIETGTGSALNWNVSVTGDYTIMAISNATCGPIPMTGTAHIVVGLPNVYDVTGGGAICPGITSDISLSGSDIGTRYYLKLGSTVMLSTEKDGNGYPLEWCSIDVAGTYTVVAKQGTCNYRNMNNLSSPIVEIGTPETPEVTGNYTTTLNGSVTLSTQGETGVTYTWHDLNGQSLGSGSSLVLSNMDSIIEVVVVANNGGCSTSTKVTAGYAVVQSPGITPQLTSACGHHYLQRSGNPATEHKWYWQGKNAEGKEQLIDAELYDYRVATSGTYYLRSFNELAGIWADQPMAIVVNLSDPSSIKPTNCSDITAMQVAGKPGAYTAGTYNYIRSYDVFEETNQQLTETAAENAILNETDNSKVQQATQYIDGLGRPLQTVSHKASPGNTDIIQPVTYDAYGRPVRQYLPYTAQDATNDLRKDPFDDQKDFYQGATGITAHFPDEDALYGEALLEKSPLSRAKLSTAPGDAWTGNRVGTMADWRTNTSAEGIRRWTTTTHPQTTAAYTPGELYVSVTTDENGNQIKEYANAKGQVILKQVQSEDDGLAGHDDWFNTYYVYNTYNQLAFVLPPRAVELLEANNWNWTNANVGDLIFSYAYDGRNRMITKQVPGSDRVDMVYDKLDRLVATQDANQRAINQWTFTKYDALSRPVMTGFVTIASTRTQLQTTTSGWTNDLHVKREGLTTSGVLEGATITTSMRDESITTYRAKNTGYVDYLAGFTSETGADFATALVPSLSHEYTFYEGYHDATFPLLADPTITWEMNTVNYYDDYDFTNKAWSNDFNGFFAQGTQNALAPTQHPDATGMATGSKVRILYSDDWLTTVMFYDNRGRVVQTQGENHVGGTDISTTQYDFAGRVLHTYSIHNNPNAQIRTTTRILKRFEYDHAGRLLSIQQKVNDFGSLKTLVANTYNTLGELETKTLGDNLESLDYKYNVRGWLKSINGDYVASGSGSHFFGMDLSYDDGFEQNQLNGNIAGVTWRSKSSSKKRAYGFDYDNTNRLLVADYHQNDGTSNTWSQVTADFSTSYGYDANGNILNLNRQGVVAGTITPIDQLTYNYGSGYNMAGNSNQLVAVADPKGDLGQGDFKDVVNPVDYEYDLNGNMKDDLNKGITNITYNHLNLPVVVSFGSSKSITYSYDAAGIKLSKVVNDNGNLTTTDYAGGFIYENNALQHFAHEEGRVRTNENNGLSYDYFIKDHLGNTRMTLTEDQETTTYRATMEVGTNTSGEVVDDYEESVFLYIDQVRDNTNTTANTTNVPGINDEYTARLNGSQAGRTVGPAKMIVVNPGDQVDVSVDYYHGGSYTDTGAESKANMVSAISGLFGGASTGTLQETAVFNQFNAPLASAAAYVGTRGDANKPRAYLNVVVFDKDFNLMSTGSAFKQTQSQSGFGALSHNITLAEGGYVYVYLSNESQTDFNVHFDNLEIAHTNGTILQEDHYYPFGLTINALSSSAPLSKPNKFKYNSFEEQTDFDLGWYDYQARFYDPQLGRFMQVDPMADAMRRHSTYNYAFDNPIRFIDPDGMMPEEATDGEQSNGDQGGCDPNDPCYLETVVAEEVMILKHAVYDLVLENPLLRAVIGRKKAKWVVNEEGNWETDFVDAPERSYLEGVKERGANMLTLLTLGRGGGPSGGLFAKTGAKSTLDDIVNIIEDSAGNSFWTATKKKTPAGNAMGHWDKHFAEFPEFSNAAEYVQGTLDFLNNSPKGTLTKTRANGDVLKYHPASNTFAVQNADRAARTMFRPTDGIKYWNAQ